MRDLPSDANIRFRIFTFKITKKRLLFDIEHQFHGSPGPHSRLLVRDHSHNHNLTFFRVPGIRYPRPHQPGVQIFSSWQMGVGVGVITGVGDGDGVIVGRMVGVGKGVIVSVGVGVTVGIGVGVTVGITVGVGVGSVVGITDGMSVGVGVIVVTGSNVTAWPMNDI